MRVTKRLPIFPWNKGLDRTSIPGTQDFASLYAIKNLILKNNGSRKKAPGVEALSYISSTTGYLQGLTHYIATNGSNQVDEIIRVLNGRIEILQNGEFIDKTPSDVSINPNDDVSFARYGNAIIMFFQSTKPLYYVYGGDVVELEVFASHKDSPPRFGSIHDYRLFYSGRGENPHVVYASAVDDINSYTLATGGFSMRVFDGDGDPVGINGISKPFRGDLYFYKYNSVYRCSRGGYGYTLDLFTDEIGTVAHDTIVVTNNDIFWVSERGIHSIQVTAKYGAAEEYTLTYPIYEYFQEIVNWNRASQMKAVYDSASNTYLLNYPSSSSADRDKIIGFNTRSKEFFEIEHSEISYLASYNEYGKKRVLVANPLGQIGIMRENHTKFFDLPINVSFSSGLIFPFKDPSVVVNFTKAKIYLKPTTKETTIRIAYDIDGKFVDTKEIDSFGSGSGSFIVDDPNANPGDPIGDSQILGARSNMAVREIDLRGEGSAIQFHFTHEPPEDDLEQNFEIFGLTIEYQYNDDKDADINV